MVHMVQYVYNTFSEEDYLILIIPSIAACFISDPVVFAAFLVPIFFIHFFTVVIVAGVMFLFRLTWLFGALPKLCAPQCFSGFLHLPVLLCVQ